MQIVIEIDDEVYKEIKEGLYDKNVRKMAIAIGNGIPLPKDNKCKWIHYDYRTVCPGEHDIDNPYWRIPENRIEALKYCPYCGREIEIEADKAESEE